MRMNDLPASLAPARPGVRLPACRLDALAHACPALCSLVPGDPRILFAAHSSGGHRQCRLAQVAHERGVQEFVADKTRVVVQGHFRIVQLDIQALCVRVAWVDAGVTKVTQQQAIQLTVWHP